MLPQTITDLVVGSARVDHDRLARLSCEVELRLEEPALRIARRVVPEEVEPGLADGDRLRVVEQRTQLADALGLDPAGLVRVDAERRVDALVAFGEHKGRLRLRERGRDGDDAFDAGASRA